MESRRNTFLLLVCHLLCVVFTQETTTTNNNLEVLKDDHVTIGNPTQFTCTIPAILSDEVQTCYIKTSGGDTLLVQGGSVTFSNGSTAPGYTAMDNGNELKTCGLGINIVGQQDIGDWECNIIRTSGNTNLFTGIINLRENGLVPNIRLPRNTIPNSYTVDMIVSLEPDFKIDGTFHIDTTVTKDGINDGKVSLNFRYMSFDEDSISLVANGNTPLEITEHIYDFERQRYTIRYDGSEFLGLIYSLEISGSYMGNVVEGSDGMYRDSYVDRQSGETRFLAATQFETYESHYAYPNFDEPDLKATFKFRIGHASQFTAISNMPVVNEGEAVAGYPGYVWTEFDDLPLTPTYLTAFAVGEFIAVDSEPTGNGVLFQTWSRPDLYDLQLAEYPKVLGSQILQYYGDLFDYTYPLPKQSQIGYPNKGGAMENWGLVTYGEYLLQSDDNYLSTNDKSSIVRVNAHELAHQWFGDVVTCKWWDDIWLNEGFATYVQYIGGDYFDPTLFLKERFYIDEMEVILKNDARPESRVMLDPVDHPYNSNFGDNTYNRGGTMLRMMEHFLTFPTLQKGLQRYLKDFAFFNAETPDLWVYLNTVGQEDGTLGPQYDIETIMNTWMRQENYPLLTVTRDYNAGSVTLTQDRFLYVEDPDGGANNPYGYQWYIPLTYTLFENGQGDFENTKISNFFLEPNSALNFGLGQSDEAIIFNIQSVGYYRVNYDEENWNRITDILNADFTAIHLINRAAMISDTFYLARAGIVSYDLPNQLTAYLAAENEYIVLSSALNVWKELESMGTLPADAQQLKDFLYATLSAKYDTIGLEELVGGTAKDNLLQRELALEFCRADYAPCVTAARQLFDDWQQVANPEDLATNPINIQVRYPVYCTAIRTGGADELAFLQNVLDNTYNPQEKRTIESALRCSPNKEHLEKILDVARGKSFKLLEYEICQMSQFKSGENVALEYLMRNLQELKMRYPQITFSNSIESMKNAIEEMKSKCAY